MPANGRKTLKIAGTTFGAIVVLGILYLLLADLGRYQPRIENWVSESTGREFRINGEFELDVLPSLSIYAENVTLANAPWSSGGEMLEVGRFSVEVSLWSLLAPPIVIYDLEVADVTVLVEVNADDAVNWDIGSADEVLATDEDQTSADELPAEVRAADIRNVKVVYREPDSDELPVTLDELTIQTNSHGHQEINGQAQWADLPIILAGTIDSQDAEIEATFGDVRFESTTGYENDAVGFDISVGPLDALGELIAVENLPSETLSIAGNLAARGDVVVLNQLVATLGPARLAFDGEFAPTDERLSIDPFELTSGESDVSGSLIFDIGDVPGLELHARSTLLDLSQHASDPDTGDAAAEPSPTDDDADRRYVFKDEPISTAALQGYRADIDVEIERVRMATGSFEDFQLKTTIEDGTLEVTNSFRGDRGGEFEEHLTITTSGSNVEMTVTAAARDLKMGTLSGKDVSDELIPATDVVLEFHASGTTPRQLASSANGQIIFTQGAGRVRNELIGKLSGDIISQLFSALNPLAKEEKFSNWECTVFAIDFEDGLGKINGFLLQSDKLMIVGGGEIDLNTENLNIEFNTMPREGVGVSADMFVTPFVALSGTLSKPGVALNSKGVLLSGGAAVLTGGLSFLYKGLVDRATATTDRCEKTLAEIGAPASNEDQ